MKRLCDSGLERQFLDFLDQHGLRLPERAQHHYEQLGTRPDFSYTGENPAFIYVDGPPNDYPDRQTRDTAQTAALTAEGITVIRFNHAADWESVVSRFPSVFGRPGTRHPEQIEAAVFTIRFEKPDHSGFSESEKSLCRQESQLALENLLRECCAGANLDLSVCFAGDGLSSYWADFVIEVLKSAAVVGGVVASTPYVLHLLGMCLESAGDLTNRLATGMTTTGGSLKSVAWRLTPKPGESSEKLPRPGCFGHADLIDRRTKRCKECEMRSACETAVEEGGRA